MGKLRSETTFDAAVSGQQGAQHCPAVAGCINVAISRACRDRPEVQQYGVEMRMLHT